MGLTPPFIIHQVHDQLPDPTRIVVLQTEEQMRKAVITTNDPVRTIIRNANTPLDEEEACKSRSNLSLTQMLNRKKAEKSSATQI